MNLLANKLPVFSCLALFSTGNTGIGYYTQSFMVTEGLN